MRPLAIGLMLTFALSACGGADEDQGAAAPSPSSNSAGLASAQEACALVDMASLFSTQFRQPQISERLDAAQSAAEAEDKYRGIYDAYKAAGDAAVALDVPVGDPRAAQAKADLERAVEELQRQCARVPGTATK